MREFLLKRDFCKVEEILLNQLSCDKSIELLFKLAMVRLQFPFEDEETSISYLNDILAQDKYNFEAIIIKMYIQNYCYGGNMDKDYDTLVEKDWESNYKNAIVDYIISWKADNDIEKKKQLIKSTETYPFFVHNYQKLGDIYMSNGERILAKECYMKALKNVVSTTYSEFEAIDKQEFIDEYILGIKLSSINYDSLKGKAFS